MGGRGQKIPGKSAGHFTGSFDDEEKKAIRMLTGGTWKSTSVTSKMNSNLRENGVLNSVQQKYADTLDRALDKYETDRAITVYRGAGAGLLGGYSTFEEIQSLIGKTVQDNGYMSASTQRDKAFPDNIQYEMQIPKNTRAGAVVREYSKHQDEEEFLTKRRTQWKVKGVRRDGKHIIVTIGYIGQGKWDIPKRYYRDWIDGQ